MQITLLIISYSILKYRISKINTSDQVFYNKFEIFELSIRKFLKSGELKEALISKMNKNFHIHRDILNIVIQAYYCCDILFNNNLAYNKIIGINYEGINIFTNFQIFKCRKAILSQCKASEMQCIQFYQYLKDFEKLKLDDNDFCEKYFKFLLGVIEPDPNILKLKSYINELVDSKSLLINSYESILKIFPNSKEINKMYGSFLINILFDINKGESYYHKRNKSIANKRNAIKEDFSKINDRGFLIFSGNIKNIGKVIYANKTFLKLMGTSRDLIKSSFFSHFLPKSYSKDHNLLLQHFMSNFRGNTVYKSLPLFLVNYNGHLSEFFISLECIADKDSINFLCSIDPIHSGERELAIIDLNGNICSHSKDFINMLGYDDKNAEGMNIQYYMPDIVISELTIDSIYEIKRRKTINIEKETINTIGIILKCCKIDEITIYVLFITDDSNQLNSWKLKRNFYDIQGTDYKYLTTENQQLDEEQEKIDEELELKAASKHVLQIPDKNNYNSNNKKMKNSSTQSKIDTHSTTIGLLDNYELKAAEKSTKVIGATRIFLLVSVAYI